MQLTDSQIGLIVSVALAILPHAVAIVPGLAKAQGVIGAVLKVLAANYGYAKNATIDIAVAATGSADKPVDQQDTVTPKPE